jgi:TatD DNase family protein
MLIDTHCHYNLDPLYGTAGADWQRHWQRAQDAGVTHSVVVGTNHSTSLRAIALAAAQPRFIAAVGFHPHAVAEAIAAGEIVDSRTIKNWTLQLQEVLAKNASTQLIGAVGEIGLDYFRLAVGNSDHQNEIQLQQELCIQQLLLADRAGLPVILHVRDTGTRAYSDILRLVRTYRQSNVPFILHCVSGSLEYVQEAVALGAYIGIAGNSTYKNAASIREIIQSTPRDRLLLETDAPFLPPVPHRGKTCEPWMIELTSKYLTEECGISLETVYTNTLRVFTTLKTS